jgi:hypothetical protein
MTAIKNRLPKIISNISLPVFWSLWHGRDRLRDGAQRRPHNFRGMLTIPPVASSCGTLGRH